MQAAVRRRCTRSAALLALAALGGACRSTEGRPARAPRPSLATEASELPPFATPGVWRYHPSQPARINAELALPSGGRLLAGRRGERWLADGAGQGMTAASVLAPEDLVGILKGPGGTFIFVGASGVSYEARSPIGPFFRSSAPLEPLSSVTSSGSAILGVRRDRGLLRSEDGGATWKPTGPTGAKFVSVLLGEGGQGLALSVPEALFETKDAGLTFTKLPAQSVGALALERLPDQSLGVVAALGPYRYRAGASPALERLPASTQVSASGVETPHGPSALALSEGRAAATAGRYYELSLSDKKNGGWQLLSGPSEGPLAARALAELGACRAVKLAAFEQSLAIACFRSGAESPTQPIELWSSLDGGRSFRANAPPLDGNLSAFRMALGREQSLLLSGVCPSYAAGAGCAPQGIAWRAPASAEAKASKAEAAAFRAAAAPSLVDTALALAFSVDGSTAYAVGRRTKGGVLAVFVSRDRGRSFEAEDLALPSGDESAGEERWESGASGLRVDALVPAEDGTVGLSVSRYRSRAWLVLDEAGRVLSVARPPEPRALLGVAGSRALAVSPATSEVWESLDAGATFQSLGRLPIDVCSGSSPCEVPLACTPYGCALGADISRLGWGGQAEDDAWVLPAPAAPPVDYSVPRLKTPISCLLDAGSWHPLEGVTEFPTASEAAIGKAAWFASARDVTRAAAWAWVASSTASPQVEKQQLLKPSDRGPSYALVVSDQVEGVAALRYLVPEASSDGSRLSGVELAWLNLFEGKLRRATLADAGAYMPGDYVRGARGTQEADPDLLSIAEGGLYLRIHRAAGDNQPTLFFDGQRSESLPATVWPALGLSGTRSEMVHVDGEHVPILMVGRGSAVLRSRTKNGQQELSAFALGALDPARFGLAQRAGIAYAGTHAGQVIETFDSAAARAEAQLFPFRAQGEVVGPPLEVPTQLSLPERPERCSAALEAASPRIVAAHYPGTRHPVIVSDGADSVQSFITASAVLHGTPANPCVSAFDAEPATLEGTPAPTSRVILPFTDLGHAYVFRASVQGTTVRMEYHGMSCKLDANAEVPQELYRAPGALVPRAR